MSASFQSKQPMFFASSDDEDDDALNGAQSRASTSKVTQKPLFFADSDDEESSEAIARHSPPIHEDDLIEEGMDIEIPDLDDIPRASSISSVSSHCDTRNSSPDPVQSEERPVKRRRISPPVKIPANFTSAYLGSFLVGNAWSTVRGSGYVKAGDEISVERDDQVEPPLLRRRSLR
ncbi:hypothetical protein A0H81_01450 [Grifola frondosa]|uniref:Uncharacterized protein n=1 Tax=Grifola frondosa TaxID=5627 RepID=A0A1C7MRH8_GRIFR|nr:hypothetical protein A0H81_01450 [Grifola frondosa]